jgi:hypothetical protein
MSESKQQTCGKAKGWLRIQCCRPGLQEVWELLEQIRERDHKLLEIMHANMR